MFKPNNAFSATSETGRNKRECIVRRRRVTVISLYHLHEVSIIHFEKDTKGPLNTGIQYKTLPYNHICTLYYDCSEVTFPANTTTTELLVNE